MSQTRLFDGPGVLLPLTAWLWLAGGPVVGQVRLSQEDPMEVTTDTPEYCQLLLHRIDSLLRLTAAPAPHEVADLTSMGRQMCDNGQTRPGIMRLRSALMLMEKSNGAAYR